jgi:hypothetical protein
LFGTSHAILSSSLFESGPSGSVESDMIFGYEKSEAAVTTSVKLQMYYNVHRM